MSTNHGGAIGVFDSGVGGLSVLRAIRRALPFEPLIYVADSAHAPYGDREAAHVHRRASLIIERLVDDGVRAIVVACNTASVIAVESLRARHAVPIVAMEPAIKPAVLQSRSGVIGVLATRRTIDSAAVARLCALHAGDVRVMLQPCPGLVERIEAGDVDGPVVRLLLATHLSPLLDTGADVLVLGCTHYPFLAPLLSELLPSHVALVDPADAVAAQLCRRIGPARSPPCDAPPTRFTSTLDSSAHRDVMSRLWGAPVTIAVFEAGRPSRSSTRAARSPTARCSAEPRRST